ncbi:MAG TPA: cobalamin-binding protein [Eoetvoesiella sp.]
MRHNIITKLLYCLALAAGAALAPAASLAAPTAHRHPERVVALTPHITELLFAAGAGNKIVATVSSSDYPADARNIPLIGDGMNVNVEKIVALKPDLVIAWQPSGAARTLAPILAKLGIPVIYSKPETLRDIPGQIIKFGQIFNTQAIAGPTAERLNQRLTELEEQYSRRPAVNVFIEVGSAPLYTIGGDPLLNDALRNCGGVNIYARSALAAPQVSTEGVLIQQPDVIITADIDPEKLAARRQEWAKLHLPAAILGHIYAIDPDALFRPGPRLIEATEHLCQYLDRAR